MAVSTSRLPGGRCTFGPGTPLEEVAVTITVGRVGAVDVVTEIDVVTEVAALSDDRVRAVSTTNARGMVRQD